MTWVLFPSSFEKWSKYANLFCYLSIPKFDVTRGEATECLETVCPGRLSAYDAVPRVTESLVVTE